MGIILNFRKSQIDLFTGATKTKGDKSYRLEETTPSKRRWHKSGIDFSKLKRDDKITDEFKNKVLKEGLTSEPEDEYTVLRRIGLEANDSNRQKLKLAMKELQSEGKVELYFHGEKKHAELKRVGNEYKWVELKNKMGEQKRGRYLITPEGARSIKKSLFNRIFGFLRKSKQLGLDFGTKSFGKKQPTLFDKEEHIEGETKTEGGKTYQLKAETPGKARWHKTWEEEKKDKPIKPEVPQISWDKMMRRERGEEKVEGDPIDKPAEESELSGKHLEVLDFVAKKATAREEDKKIADELRRKGMIRYNQKTGWQDVTGKGQQALDDYRAKKDKPGKDEGGPVDKPEKKQEEPKKAEKSEIIDLSEITNDKAAKAAGLEVEYTRGKGKNTGKKYYRIKLPQDTKIIYEGVEREVGKYSVGSNVTEVGSPADWSGTDERAFKTKETKEKQYSEEIEKLREDKPGVAKLVDAAVESANIDIAHSPRLVWLDIFESFRAFEDKRYKPKTRVSSNIYIKQLLDYVGKTHDDIKTRGELMQEVYDRVKEKQPDRPVQKEPWEMEPDEYKQFRSEVSGQAPKSWKKDYKGVLQRALMSGKDIDRKKLEQHGIGTKVIEQGDLTKEKMDGHLMRSIPPKEDDKTPDEVVRLRASDGEIYGLVSRPYSVDPAGRRFWKFKVHHLPEVKGDEAKKLQKKLPKEEELFDRDGGSTGRWASGRTSGMKELFGEFQPKESAEEKTDTSEIPRGYEDWKLEGEKNDVKYFRSPDGSEIRRLGADGVMRFESKAHAWDQLGKRAVLGEQEKQAEKGPEKLKEPLAEGGTFNYQGKGYKITRIGSNIISASPNDGSPLGLQMTTDQFKARVGDVKTKSADEYREEVKQRDTQKQDLPKNVKAEGLTPKQLGRLNKELDKKYDFSKFGVKTFRDLIDKGVFTEKRTHAPEPNRKHLNRLFGPEQEEYLKRLEDKTEYSVYAGDSSYDVPKVIYDALDIPDKTKKEETQDKPKKDSHEFDLYSGAK